MVTTGSLVAVFLALPIPPVGLDRLVTQVSDVAAEVSELSEGAKEIRTPETASPTRPEWLTADPAWLSRTRAARVVVSAENEAACNGALEREILVEINKQIVLGTEQGKLPERLAAQVLAEPSDRALVTLDERFTETIADAHQPSGELMRCWGLIHFTPAFFQAVEQRVGAIQRVDRLQTVGFVAGSTVLALCISFGYLHGLRRLPAPLVAGGMVGLAIAWCAAALVLFRMFF